jgi:hypothetical protein
VRHPQFFNRLTERLRRIWKVAPAVLCRYSPPHVRHSRFDPNRSG